MDDKRRCAAGRWAASILLAAFSVGLAASAMAQFSISIQEIGPKQSDLDPTDPDGASGGRVNGLAISADNNQLMYAASEWGGLFRSTNGGRNWQHLPGHVPHATWDVEIDPGNSNRVYATSFFDGRVQSRAGINISTNGGSTWTLPATAMAPENFCRQALRRVQPSAFGIAISEDDPQDIYIGTNCGLAISNDRGASWRYVDPTPVDGADNVWDVAVHHSGIIDICGDDGHQRSTDGGVTWTTATGLNRLPSGRCSIVASPDESYVLFAVVGTSIYETLDGGANWANTYDNPRPQGRIPFVAANKRSSTQFDLWFGDVQLHRGTCTTPTVPSPGGNQRCQDSTNWAGPFTRSAGGHDDMGDVVFDPQVTTDACPLLMSSDGGVYYNTRTSSPNCHEPIWEQPDVTPQAVWNWDMAGAPRAGTIGEDLYFGNQDTGSFGTTTAGANPPNWTNRDCCDAFDIVAESARVLTTICCYGGGRSTRLFIRDPGLVGGGEIANYPPGNLRGFQTLDSIASYGPGRYVIITSQGIYVTDDITANPIQWRALGSGSVPTNACGIQTARSSNNVTFYVKNGGCDGDRQGTLWRYEGTAANGVWQQVAGPGGGQFGIFAVHPNDPNRLIASDLGGAGGPAMTRTHDGGTTWTAMPQLDALMTSNGAFHYENDLGPRRFTNLGGYPQPSMVAFDPHDDEILAAGGVDSGVFISVDGGSNWQLSTDPHSPAVSGVPHIPRPLFAYFDHDDPNQIKLYVGTKGRGQWRIAFSKQPQSRPVSLPWLRLILK